MGKVTLSGIVTLFSATSLCKKTWSKRFKITMFVKLGLLKGVKLKFFNFVLSIQNSVLA